MGNLSSLNVRHERKHCSLDEHLAELREVQRKEAINTVKLCFVFLAATKPCPLREAIHVIVTICFRQSIRFHAAQKGLSPFVALQAYRGLRMNHVRGHRVRPCGNTFSCQNKRIQFSCNQNCKIRDIKELEIHQLAWLLTHPLKQSKPGQAVKPELSPK